MRGAPDCRLRLWAEEWRADISSLVLAVLGPTNSGVHRRFLSSVTVSYLCINSGIVACSSTCRVTPPRIN
jgi:hypothetical protein